MTKGIGRIFIGLVLAVSLAACDSSASEQATEAADPSADPTADMDVPVMGEPVNVLAFGDSLFAGYGVDQAEAYPAILQNALRAKGINAAVTNAGVSGDTTAAGLQRFAFTLDAQETQPDLVIVELGGNDLLRGLSPDETRENLDAMLAELKKRDIDALLMGMRAPPNYGPEFQAKFDGLYGDLAKQYDADLVPFFLESIYRSPELFQSDRIHPTPEGIEQLVAATLETVEGALPVSGPEKAE
ncbi:MAG: arylesterase [Erythrobacter sp.]